MNIKIYSDSIIYVIAPANTATGGPELLHQLVYHLRKDLGVNAYMHYIRRKDNYSSPVHKAYEKYGNPFVDTIEDKEKNILIGAEIDRHIKTIKNYSNIRKYIWWLSVDNFFMSAILTNRNILVYRAVNKVGNLLLSKPLVNLEEKIYKKINFNTELSKKIKGINAHLVQSNYALHYLSTQGILKEKIAYLSDYLNSNFLEIETDLLSKKNIVVYNPKKGYGFTKKIINEAPDLIFVPIINMTREQAIETLQKAKVYIDFGNHPGKDRIPREAAILGCCVITGKKGSASFYEDVPIPEEYKFDDEENNIPQIINKIKDCFENFEERYKDFDNYRVMIKKEPQRFIEDLKKIFITEKV
jgi:hypothetical protein